MPLCEPLRKPPKLAHEPLSEPLQHLRPQPGHGPAMRGAIARVLQPAGRGQRCQRTLCGTLFDAGGCATTLGAPEMFPTKNTTNVETVTRND
jgi:hypothetical protein